VATVAHAQFDLSSDVEALEREVVEEV
jgi:hypothetical protein